MKNLLNRLAYFLRFHNPRIQIADKAIIYPKAMFRTTNESKIIIGTGTYIHDYSIIDASRGKIEIGDYSSVNSFTTLQGRGGLKIGNYVRIATNCAIIAANHKFEDKKIPIASQGFTTKGIIINDDVWIGANCVIVDGVEIGKGSVIGAGSVVTKSIPEYSIAVGVPAKVIKQR